MQKQIRKVKRTATKMVNAAGAVITTAKKRVQRAAARQRLRQKVRKAGKALREVGKAAGLAALAAGAAKAFTEITTARGRAVRRA